MNIGFSKHEKGKLVYYSVDTFTNTGLVRHGFSTRLGGVSVGETSSLNLGFNKKDTHENVRKNFDTICSVLGIDAAMLVLSNQVHENQVRVITKNDCGKGITKESDITGVDALVCGESGVPFVIFYADCVPVMFLDPVKKVCALAHSGWRSTVKNICGEVIRVMKKDFCSNPADIICAIGPSIAQCCFKVDDDVAQMFEKKYYQTRAKKYHIDLWRVVEDQLLASGVDKKNITLSNMCTCCNNDIFFSSRAQNGKMGLMGAFIELI